MDTGLAFPEHNAIRPRQHSTFASGDHARLGTILQIVGERLAESMDLAPDSDVLDVTAGNCDAALAFARRWCEVTSIPCVQVALERSAMPVDAYAARSSHRPANAAVLPFGDESFDGVVSTFGIMFAPNETLAANELSRVCRKGGRIGFAGWTPASFVGQLFTTVGRYAPSGAASALARWGSEAWIERTFCRHARTIAVRHRTFVFRYRSPAHFVEDFSALHWPVRVAFASLDVKGRASLKRDLVAVVDRFDTAIDGSVRVPSAYVEVVIDKA